MGGDERAREAERLRVAGQRYQATQAHWRAVARERRKQARAVNYVIGGVYYRLTPGQRISLPLTDGRTLTLCGEGCGGS